MTIKLGELTWLETNQLVKSNAVIVVSTAAFE